MRILFIRHGQPNYQSDCLTETGRHQARDTALRLLGQGIEALYSSPFGRAKETAQYTADGLGLPVQVLDFMHELHWGNREGKPVFAGGHPWDTANELMRRGWDVTRPDWAAHPLYENNDVVSEAARVARETDGWMRALGYARDGLYYHCEGYDHPHTVALFSHGGSSTAVLARLFNLPFPYLCAMMHMPFCSVTAVRFSDRPFEKALPCLELFGDAAHVPYGQEAP